MVTSPKVKFPMLAYEPSLLVASASNPRPCNPVSPTLCVNWCKIDSQSFQSLTHSFQFQCPLILFIFSTLRTLCEKHPGVGVHAHQIFSVFPTVALTTIESKRSTKRPPISFKMITFHHTPGVQATASRSHLACGDGLQDNVRFPPAAFSNREAQGRHSGRPQRAEKRAKCRLRTS
jgi:hypothetical protein